MEDIRIRTARKEELGILGGMRARLQELLTECDPRLWRLSQEQLDNAIPYYAEVMARSTNRILVAVDGRDRPIAMIMVRLIENKMLDPDRYGRIDDAWVEPEYRRQGVMRRLVQAAVDFLETLGVKTVLLDFAVKNLVSEHAWLGLGFVPVLTIATATTEELKKKS